MLRKPSWYRWRLIIPMALLVAALMIGCTVSPEEAGQAEADIAGLPVEVTATAIEMYNDYDANEVAANLKYDGKVLEVSGIVANISGGDDQAYYVDLATGQFTLTSVRCHFGENHLADIAQMLKGDKVTLRGKGDEGEDRDPFTIDVIGCSLETVRQGGGSFEAYNQLVASAASAMRDYEHWGSRLAEGLDVYPPLRERYETLVATGDITDGSTLLRLPEYNRLHQAYEERIVERDGLFLQYQQLVQDRDVSYEDGDPQRAFEQAREAVSLAERLRDLNQQAQLDVGHLVWSVEIINGQIERELEDINRQTERELEEISSQTERQLEELDNQLKRELDAINRQTERALEGGTDAE